MAGGFSLPALRRRSRLAGAVGADALPTVWSPDVGDGGHHLPGHTQTAGGLVSGHVLGGESEERSQCLGAAEGAGAGQLQDRVDVAAQVPTSDGTARAWSTDGAGGSGRNLLGRPGGGRARPTDRAQILDFDRAPKTWAGPRADPP